jgi:HPt (histidine-containing phosphotransfer) domain-containing protein
MNDIDLPTQRKYIERRSLDLNQCEEGLATQDLTILERIGHNLKGNGLSFGFPELSQLGREMEKSAKEADLIKASQCVSSLREWVLNHPLPQ